ncbi:MAG: histone deacetylase [Spirochaetes bacterium]|nr:histone deacetylase [Spirochaetota bacterium]
MPFNLYYDDRFLLHDTGRGHPENADRLRAVIAAINAGGFTNLSRPAFFPAPLDIIALVHERSYIERVKNTIAAGERILPTGDTPVSAGSWDAALLAAGAVTAACDAMMAGTRSFCLVRPPGHHASSNRGMGFCIFNNAAIAARYVQRRHGIKHVLIADIDVHHGNGTQDIFYRDGSVFYFSVHEDGIYPGTGHADERGADRGRGCIMNVPLSRGSGDEAALNALRQQLVPAMRTFRPDFVIVSAGFDAHTGDPVGGLAYSDDGYASIARMLIDIADTYASGRIVCTLEGGYDGAALGSSVVRVIRMLMETKH